MTQSQSLNSSDSPHPADKTGFGFPNECRIKSGADFQKVYARRLKAGDGFLLIFADRNELGWTRIGLSVSKKHGNAVCRNRIKRLLREAFRLVRSQLPAGYDLVLIPRQGAAATLGEFQRSLLGLTAKIAHRDQGSTDVR